VVREQLVADMADPKFGQALLDFIEAFAVRGGANGVDVDADRVDEGVGASRRRGLGAAGRRRQQGDGGNDGNDRGSDQGIPFNEFRRRR
jgi:hypothetical protein